MSSPLLAMPDIVSVWGNGEGLYQDAAGTIVAAAEGDRIGRWADQVSNHHVVQATAGQRATLDAATPWKGAPGVVFDHLANQVLASSTFNATSGVTEGCWFLAYQRDRGDRGQGLLETPNGVLALYDSAGSVQFEHHLSAGQYAIYRDNAYHGKAMVAIHDGSQAGADRYRLRINRTERTIRDQVGTVDAVTAVTGPGLNMGAGLSGTILEAGYLARVPTAEEIAIWETYCADQFFAQGESKVHVLGDSVPRGYPFNTEDGLNWPSQLSIILGWPVQNVSTVAQTIALMELSGSAIDQDRDEWRDRDVVVLECGTNDGFQGRSGEQAIADMTVSVANRHLFGYEVWVQTLPFAWPGGQGLTDPTQEEYDTFRAIYNTAVRARSLGQDGVFDLAAEPGFEDPIDTTYYNADLTHMDAPGSLAIAEAAAVVIAAGPPPPPQAEASGVGAGAGMRRGARP